MPRSSFQLLGGDINSTTLDFDGITASSIASHNTISTTTAAPTSSSSKFSSSSSSSFLPFSSPVSLQPLKSAPLREREELWQRLKDSAFSLLEDRFLVEKLLFQPRQIVDTELRNAFGLWKLGLAQELQEEQKKRQIEKERETIPSESTQNLKRRRSLSSSSSPPLSDLFVSTSTPSLSVLQSHITSLFSDPRYRSRLELLKLDVQLQMEANSGRNGKQEGEKEEKEGEGKKGKRRGIQRRGSIGEKGGTERLLTIVIYANRKQRLQAEAAAAASSSTTASPYSFSSSSSSSPISITSPLRSCLSQSLLLKHRFDHQLYKQHLNTETGVQTIIMEFEGDEEKYDENQLIMRTKMRGESGKIEGNGEGVGPITSLSHLSSASLLQTFSRYCSSPSLLSTELSYSSSLSSLHSFHSSLSSLSSSLSTDKASKLSLLHHLEQLQRLQTLNQLEEEVEREIKRIRIEHLQRVEIECRKLRKEYEVYEEKIEGFYRAEKKQLEIMEERVKRNHYEEVEKKYKQAKTKREQVLKTEQLPRLLVFAQDFQAPRLLYDCQMLLSLSLSSFILSPLLLSPLLDQGTCRMLVTSASNKELEKIEKSEIVGEIERGEMEKIEERWGRGRGRRKRRGGGEGGGEEEEEEEEGGEEEDVRLDITLKQWIEKTGGVEGGLRSEEELNSLKEVLLDLMKDRQQKAIEFTKYNRNLSSSSSSSSSSPPLPPPPSLSLLQLLSLLHIREYVYDELQHRHSQQQLALTKSDMKEMNEALKDTMKEKGRMESPLFAPLRRQIGGGRDSAGKVKLYLFQQLVRRVIDLQSQRVPFLEPIPSSLRITTSTSHLPLPLSSSPSSSSLSPSSRSPRRPPNKSDILVRIIQPYRYATLRTAIGFQDVEHRRIPPLAAGARDREKEKKEKEEEKKREKGKKKEKEYRVLSEMERKKNRWMYECRINSLDGGAANIMIGWDIDLHQNEEEEEEEEAKRGKIVMEDDGLPYTMQLPSIASLKRDEMERQAQAERVQAKREQSASTYHSYINSTPARTAATPTAAASTLNAQTAIANSNAALLAAMSSIPHSTAFSSASSSFSSSSSSSSFSCRATGVLWQNDGILYHNGNAIQIGVGFEEGDIVGTALDLHENCVYFIKNGFVIATTKTRGGTSFRLKVGEEQRGDGGKGGGRGGGTISFPTSPTFKRGVLLGQKKAQADTQTLLEEKQLHSPSPSSSRPTLPPPSFSSSSSSSSPPPPPTLSEDILIRTLSSLSSSHSLSHSSSLYPHLSLTTGLLPTMAVESIEQKKAKEREKEKERERIREEERRLEEELKHLGCGEVEGQAYSTSFTSLPLDCVGFPSVLSVESFNHMGEERKKETFGIEVIHREKEKEREKGENLNGSWCVPYVLRPCVSLYTRKSPPASSSAPVPSTSTMSYLARFAISTMLKASSSECGLTMNMNGGFAWQLKGFRPVKHAMGRVGENAPEMQRKQ